MSISLKPHNVETYEKVVDKMQESDRVAVIHPTGTGKMFIALKLLEENKGKKAIYLAPSNAILHDVKKNIFAEGMTMADFPLLKRITYQKLAGMSDEEIKELDADIIILDEFHHCGAPEWGKGVERLIQRNKGAKILGLSATPLRYFDGLRDMADELFENNVASEMSLEEAIERGILPEATYVSTLYGYDKALEDMQENIDKIKDNVKHQQAQSLLNDLRKKLNVDTYNLSELFSTYMQNPNGKYIIFCRNIEDMNEKIEQAQKMFDGVNHNITVRAVSSQIKESDRILTEFEQDTDEDTLKLLYAVNMINEGYHINDLDGVIMIRPTFSPTIFTQQLGRALTVAGDKKPMVLDLVNNFDSCKIIEDFAETMRQYKGRDGSGRTEKAKRSRISIFDKTKEFREIAEKITELSSRKRISLEGKIQIFEKFSKTGEVLVGNTIFEGYPIGQWAVQIRNGLNRINNGKQGKQTINPTKEQLERLEDLGILERQIDSTIDEKIDKLVEWRRKYPKATITPIVSGEVLSEYAGAEEEQKQLIEEYEKMLRYYDYVRARKSKGKLDENQIKKCRDGNVGGVFGENLEATSAIKSETDELMKKYGLNEETINLIRKQYGSIDEFRKIYIEAVINQNVNQVIHKDLLKSANLIRGFDFSSPDWVIRNSGLTDLIYDICNMYSTSIEANLFINYGGLEEKFIELIREDGFTEDEEQVLFMLYGVNGKEQVNKAQIARNIGKSSSRISQIVERSIRKLKHPSRTRQLDLKNRIPDIDYDLQKRIIEEYFKNFDIFVSIDPVSMDEDVKTKLTNMLSEGIEKTKKRNEQVTIINQMSKEQKLDILKARFGKRINSSDISVVPPWHRGCSYIEEKDGVDINEELLDEWLIIDILYKECVDSEYCQNKVFEFMINSFSNSELIEVGKKEEIEELITNNEYFSEEKKEELKELLGKRIQVAVKDDAEQRIYKEIQAYTPSSILSMTIEDLDFTVRTFYCLKRAGIGNVQDLVEKTDEDIMNVPVLSKKGYDEVIKKLQSLGIEMVDGHFVDTNSDTDIKKMRELEERINSSEYLSEEKKEEFRELLYQTFGVTGADNQEVQNDLGNIESSETPEELSKEDESSETPEESSKEDYESSEALEELSKDELVRHILELQKTIAKQREEIDELSSQKKEEINE